MYNENIKSDRPLQIVENERVEKMEELNNMWDWLIDNGIATDEELRLITDINGYNMETLNDVLYARTGYHDREQMEGEE